MSIEQKESFFMKDCTKGHKGAEAVMDFILSWTLRNTANEDVKANKPYLYAQCKCILQKLLGKNSLGEVKDIWVEKQWENIDLFVRVILENDEKHIIVIEDKVFQPLKPHQVSEYVNSTERWKSGSQDWKNAQTHYCVITGYEGGDNGFAQLEEVCAGTEWQIFSMTDLPDWEAEKETESDLFNEFWFRSW